MAVPFRRTSKTKKRMRRTHLKKTASTLTTCPNCKAAIKPHRMCPKCGFYKGQEIVNTTKEKEVKEPKITAKSKKENKVIKENKKTIAPKVANITKKANIKRTADK